MFSRIARLPLRRCLHTGVSASNNSAKYFGRTAKIIVGVSVFSTAYLTWRLRERHHIALDSPSSHNDSPSSTSKSSLIHSNPPSELTTSSNSLPNGEIPPSSKDSDTGAISGDTENEDEEDSSSEGSGGAFNPETGEINWDCPCLGGMAHGPCGPEFREAFSCFVFSEQEPKGIDCVEKFKNMQNCFKEHPEIYADEIMDDEEEQLEQPESSNTDKVDDDSTPELNAPSKRPIEGEAL